MEREKIYALMMSALDGEELTATDSAEMDAYLLHDTDLAQEWESMQRVDTLFRLTPLVAPPANFAQRTLERLPAPSRNHVWAVSAFYIALLIGGLIPIVAGLWLLTAYGDVLQQTVVFQALNQTVGVSLQALGAILGAVGTVAANAVNDQPFVMGWIFLLLGIVVMWRNVYRYMLQPTPLPVRSVRR
jgi:ferric-dicitrate binding protein FerR (iron transport regulator)